MSQQTSATTPFMMRAIEEGIDFVGGKKDGELARTLFVIAAHHYVLDISVLVGVIGDRDDPSQALSGLTLHTE